MPLLKDLRIFDPKIPPQHRTPNRLLYGVICFMALSVENSAALAFNLVCQNKGA